MKKYQFDEVQKENIDSWINTAKDQCIENGLYPIMIITMDVEMRMPAITGCQYLDKKKVAHVLECLLDMINNGAVIERTTMRVHGKGKEGGK